MERFNDFTAEPNKEDEREDHTCDEEGIPDCDICADCKEHASFCSECGESNCCGAGEVSI